MRIAVGKVVVELIDVGDRIVSHMRHTGRFEPDTLVVWSRLCALSAGRTVIDAGAYTGLFGIAAALYGCKVLAFEPMPGNYERLLLNSRASGVDGRMFTPYREALSDFDGMTPIRFNPAVVGLTSGATLTDAKIGNQPISTINIPCRRVDGFGLDDLALMKIDVERADPLVIKGALETIERCKPTIIAEVLGDDEKSAVKAILPGYEVSEELDERNWLMVPV